MKKIISLTVVFFVLLMTTAVSAQEAPLDDPAALAAFLDPRIKTAMSASNIPGAVVVIVKDGVVIFNEGYGYANVDTKVSIDPNTTGFRVASLTKLFTATAVMQLAEQGLVDLHTDINEYLPFTIPNTYPDPITLHQLLTHSSGLDDTQTGDAALRAEEITPLADYLAENLPERIHPPGQLIDYSNHGYALAGYIVEHVDGRPFAEYVDEEILRPSNMTHSSLYQPPPSHVTVATGYSYVDGASPRPEPLDFSNVAPADTLIATGSDMARFMLAHLQVEDSPLLSTESIVQMRQTQFTHHPQLRGRSYGFLEWETNGHPLLTHTGGQLGFSSLMTLYPEENLGIFIAQNGRFGNLRFHILKQFMDRYYPASSPNTQSDNKDVQTDLSLFAGHYRSVENYFPTTYEKVATIFGGVEEVEIIDTGGSQLTIWEDHKLVPIEAQLFQLNGRSTRAFFQLDDKSEVSHLFIDGTAYEKINWYETAAFHRDLMKFTILLLSTAVIFLPLVVLWKRWGRGSIERPFNTSVAQLLAFCTSLLAVSFFIALDSSADRLADQIDYGIPNFLLIILTLPIISTVLTLPLFWFTALTWKNQNSSLLSRIYLTLLTVAAIVYALILNYWNLLGYKF